MISSGVGFVDWKPTRDGPIERASHKIRSIKILKKGNKNAKKNYLPKAVDCILFFPELVTTFCKWTTKNAKVSRLASGSWNDFYAQRNF